MNREKNFHLLTLFCFGAIAACQAIQNPPVESLLQSSERRKLPLGLCAARSPDSNASAQNQQADRTNLLALFIVKRDNLKQEYRGEIYPLAFSVDDEYVDISNDVTFWLRKNFNTEQLIKNQRQQSF